MLTWHSHTITTPNLTDNECSEQEDETDDECQAQVHTFWSFTSTWSKIQFIYKPLGFNV